MKRFIIILFLLPVVSASFAQEEFDSIPSPKASNDQLVFNILTNMLNPVPAHVTNNPLTSLGAEVYSYTPLIGKKKKVGVAMGIGIGTLNYSLGSAPGLDSNKKTIFTEFPDSIDYKKSKLTITYWDIPLEVRIRSNPNLKGNAFKFAIGFKFGIMLSNHWKYKGDSFTEDDKMLKQKIYNIDNVMKKRYGVYARVGYGKFTVFGTYYLTPLFEKDKGPESTVMTMGLSFLII